MAMLTLNRKFDFRRVFDQGKSAGGHFAVLYAFYHGEGDTAFAFIASKKSLGKLAVDRNRARRRLKEAVRHHLDLVPQGYHCVFICRRPLLEGDFKDVEQAVVRLYKKTGVLR